MKTLLTICTGLLLFVAALACMGSEQNQPRAQARAMGIEKVLGNAGSPNGGTTASPTANPLACNTTPIIIPDQGTGIANPYPSTINVSRRTGYVTGVTVHLNGLQHDYYSDIDILLVGPEGDSVILMSDVGGHCYETADLTIQDGAQQLPQSECPQSGGSYSATNYPGTYPMGDDYFPGSAPSYPSGTNLSVFTGAAPNGAWKLYVVDDTNNLGGSISSWCLDISTSENTPVATRTPTMPTSTNTATPATPPPTTTPTATGIIRCGGGFVSQATASCSPPDSYSYRFTVDEACNLNASGHIYLDAYQGSSWVTLAQTQFQRPLTGGHNVFEGTFQQVIPPQYSLYQIRISGTVNSGLSFGGQTTAAPVCSITTATATTSTATATTATTSTATATTATTSTGTATTGTATTGTATITGTSVTPVPTTTMCPIHFSDVPSDNTFYPYVRCLACRGIISGYSDGSFKPGNDVTRGQIAKIVSNAAGFQEDPGPQIYEDVAMDSPFHDFINRLTNRGVMGGYPCGLIPEYPCNPPDNRPYFRPNASSTRAQISKIVAKAAGLNTMPTGQFYTDVPEDNPFYQWIMQLTDLGVMSGYPCGILPQEPCDDQQRPYFRPYSSVTRGQASKIVANTFIPNCVTP